MDTSPPLPSFPFDRYLRYDELTALLHAAAQARPNLLRVQSIGKSFEGRDIWCATVTNFATGSDSEKPALYADGNLHATEVAPSTACLYLLHKLLSGYGMDETVTRALDTRAFYLVPRVSPDGAEVYLSNNPRFLRSSTRPYPFDEEPESGFRREDINGDDLILQMRLRDPNGAWKTHPSDPRVLVRREPTEIGGEYFRLLPEGRINGYDGVTIEPQRVTQGLDLNRNFPAFWQPEDQQKGAGPYPASEPEARAVVNFITRHKNVCFAITFHTYSGILVRPYGIGPDDLFPPDDLRVYEEIGRAGTRITGYPAVSCYRDFKFHPKKVLYGVFDDWCYEHLGLFAWTVELWCAQRQAGMEGFGVETQPGAFRFTTWDRAHTEDEALQLVQWADNHLGGKGYYDWTLFEHPELGPVEIGGWDGLYAFENPPSSFLEAEVAPHADWLIWQALTAPNLVLISAEAVALDNNLYRVRFAVQNDGYLPTYVTQKALERNAARPVIMEIQLPDGALLLAGKPRIERSQLEGRATKPAGNTGDIVDATDERATSEWIVQAASGDAITLVARHDRAGIVRVSVVCP